MTRKAVVAPRWAWAVFLSAMAAIAYFSTHSWVVRAIVFLWLTAPIIWSTRRQARKLASETAESYGHNVRNRSFGAVRADLDRMARSAFR